jgi:hypothetical protein
MSSINRVNKKQEAMIYALWRSMPLVFHELPTAKLASMGYDVDDELFQKLVSCKTKTQFKEMFHLSWETLADWDTNKEVQKMIDDFNKQSNVLKFKKDIDFHFTQATIREADAARVKLWKQLYEGWVEKQNVGVQTEALDNLAMNIRKIAERK